MAANYKSQSFSWLSFKTRFCCCCYYSFLQKLLKFQFRSRVDLCVWYSFAKRGKRIKLMKIVRRKLVVLKHKLKNFTDLQTHQVRFGQISRTEQRIIQIFFPHFKNVQENCRCVFLILFHASKSCNWFFLITNFRTKIWKNQSQLFEA